MALSRSVAVLGAGVEIAAAAELAELDPIVAELTADRLAVAQIFAPARPLEFLHPLIAAAVSEDLAPGVRRVAHRRAAAILDGVAPPDRIAAHLLECGPAGDGWVIERLCVAAGESLGRGAPETAATFLRRALAEPVDAADRAAVLLMLGTAEWRAGQSGLIATLEQALVAPGIDASTRFRASILLAQAHHEHQQPEASLEVIERELAPEQGDYGAPMLTIQALIVAIGLLDDRTAAAAIGRAEQLRECLVGLSDPPAVVLIALAAYALRMGRSAEAEQLATRALGREPYPPPFGVGNFLISTLSAIELYDVAQRVSGDLLAAARGCGSVQEIVAILLWRASCSAECGALADAEADLSWALERAEGMRRIQAIAGLVEVLIERDAVDDADELVQRCRDPHGSGSSMTARFVLARGRLRVAQRRMHEGLADLLDVGLRCERLGVGNNAVVPWRAEAALAHAAIGEYDESRCLAREHLRLAREFGRPRTIGMGLRVAGLVEGGEAGLKLLAEAVDTLGHSQAQLELARALSDHGAMLHRAGHRVQARAELERGLDLAHQLGARRIANQARSELIAGGAKPRRDAISGRDALTASELRVARLAAESMTNQEIAQALFITKMTAKAHLNRVYRKLEITGRGQLAAALAGQLAGQRSTPA